MADKEIPDKAVPDKGKEDGEERDLRGLYGAVQSAIWLIGLAILFYTGNWFPGILVLVAISGITQALLGSMAKNQEQKTGRAGGTGSFGAQRRHGGAVQLPDLWCSHQRQFSDLDRALRRHSARTARRRFR